MGIRAASLIAALVVALAASLATRRQESPLSLAEAFVRAADGADRTALKTLVHPDVVDYLSAEEPARWEEVLSGWADTRFSADYEIVVREASEVDLYDEELQAIVFGDKLRFRFPIVPPSHFLIIQMQVPDDVVAGGQLPAGSRAVEGAREEAGRWYLTVPIVEILPD
jgi:hypothetical protein